VPAGNGVESGRWTRDGGATGQNEVAIGDEPPLDEDSLFSESLPARVVQGLVRLAARSSVPAILFDTLFVPSAGKSGVTEGDVPGRPNLQYLWDKPTGQVLFRVFIDGHWVTLTGGYDNLNQFYRGADGKVIARAAGDALIVDLGALDRARERLADGRGGDPPKDNSSDERGGPKLCPEPSKESNEGWSENSAAYQQYVTRLGPEFAIWLNGVWFDGCDPGTGDMLEAKGNYEFFVDADGLWKEGLGDKSYETIRNQLGNQSRAAALDGRNVRWHVQQKAVADVLRGWADELDLTNLTVVYDPWP
jgi:hypothetical protein